MLLQNRDGYWCRFVATVPRRCTAIPQVLIGHFALARYFHGVVHNPDSK